MFKNYVVNALTATKSKIMKFIGIDPAGDNNSWISTLELRGSKLFLDKNPEKLSKSKIVESVIDTGANCVVIDGQLNYNISDKNGWRIADNQMREIGGIEKNWIQPSNSLMAVPVVSRMIAEHLRPHCATIFETHPRVCLFKKYVNDEKKIDYVKRYKSADSESNRKYMTSCLSLPWIEELRINLRKGSSRLYNDGELDSLVCSIIGYYYFFKPDLIQKLNSGNINTRGYGPVYILK